MKNKTSLVLLEQVIMVAVFAVAAAICLRAFLWADSTSRRSESIDRALLQVQNIAEYIKHTGGDLHACADEFGGTVENGQRVWCEDGYTLTATPLYPNMRYLGSVRRTAADDDGVLAEVTVSYQEVDGHG